MSTSEKYESFSKIVAYHKSSLVSVQQLYETLHLDLESYLAQEQKITEELQTLAREFEDIRTTLGALDVSTASSLLQENLSQKEFPALSKQYPHIEMLQAEQLDELASLAEVSLRKRGIDLSQDPLIQILEAQEILDIAESYNTRHGRIGWDRADYVVVTVAGIVGTLLDLLLLKIPDNPKFLLTLPQGYALTSWLRENVHRLREDYLTPLKALTEPAEQDNKAVRDSLLAFISAMCDIVRYTGTHVDEHGNVVQAERLSSTTEQEATKQIITMLLRLFSEVFTSIGMESPFERFAESADAPLAWSEVIQYLHAHGYKPQQLLIEGVLPAAIDLLVKGYWLLKHVDQQDNLERLNVKLTSMLLLSHSLVLSGHFAKSGILFQFNPFALNWDQMLRWVPLAISWINQSIERENSIRAALDEEWLSMYHANMPGAEGEKVRR
jgi:hypothetical protein